MTKNSWKESMEASGSHIDTENDEELQQTKTELDGKVAKILKLLKNKNKDKKDANLKKNSELAEFVQDFHKKYHSLYTLYENLRGEVRDRVQGREDKEGYPNSTSSSDTESFYSPREAAVKTGKSRSELQKATEELKQKLEASNLEATNLRNQLISVNEEKEALKLEHASSLGRIQELDKIIRDLKMEAEQTESTKQKLLNESSQLKKLLEEGEKKLLSLTKRHQAQQSEASARLKELERSCTQIGDREREASARIKELESLCTQVGVRESEASARIKELESLCTQIGVRESEASARIKELESLCTQRGEQESEASARLKELESMCTQRSEREKQLEHKVAEAKQLGEKNVELQNRMLELETISKRSGDELSALRKKYEENEKNLMSTIEGLKAQADNLHEEVDTLQTQKGKLEELLVRKSDEASAQLRDMTNQLNVLQQELDSLRSQKSESESQLEKLAEKTASMALHEQRMLDENEGLRILVKKHVLEVDSLSCQKSAFEEQIRAKEDEINQLKVEKDGLQSRLLEMDKSLKRRGDELSDVQKKLEVLEIDSSTQIRALRAQVNKLQQELGPLRTEKSLLELQIKREKQEYLEGRMELEKRKMELANEVACQQKALKEQDDLISKLNEEQKLIKGRFLESKLNRQIVEKKIEDMAEEFRKKFEDNLRLLIRRIRVAEQLHTENKDCYLKIKERYEQENLELKERVANNEISLRKIKEISLTANDMLTELDTVALKFEECSGHFLNRISKVSCELKFAKDWVSRKNNAIKHTKEDSDCLLAQLDVKEAEILGLREKLWKMENKTRELEKMVKEREEGMLGLGEEKREAIRQLCVWIDYHRNRSDYLNKLLSEIHSRSRKTT